MPSPKHKVGETLIYTEDNETYLFTVDSTNFSHDSENWTYSGTAVKAEKNKDAWTPVGKPKIIMSASEESLQDI